MSKGRERSGVTSSDQVASIKVNGELITIDQRTLTMGERQAMKRELAKLGYEPDELDALTATIWVVMRRTDPTLTFEEVCDSITIGSLAEADVSEVDESDPEG